MTAAGNCKRIALVLSAALRLSAVDNYHVAGVVLDSQTETPMKGASVTLAKGPGRDLVPAVVTQADGKFAFDVEEGTYRLTVHVRDLFQNFGEVVPGAGFASGVVTGPGLDTSDLTFLWNGPAAISGRVLDDAGDPVEAAFVQLLQATVIRGRRGVRTLTYAYTDDLGQYRFGSINGGTYVFGGERTPVVFAAQRRGRAGFAHHIDFRAAVLPRSSGRQFSHSDCAGARKEVTADFALTTVPGVTLKVTCNAPPGLQKTLTLFSEGVAGSQRIQQVVSMPGNTLSISAVPPGRYMVQVGGTDGQSGFTARQEISVGASDAAVELAMQAPAVITGTVRFRNAAEAISGSPLVRMIDAQTGAIFATGIRPDGSFMIGVRAGKWYPEIASRAGYYASEISVEGAEFKEGALDVADGAHIVLNITAAGDTGRLSGHVIENDKPVVAAMVALVPTRENRLPGDSYLYQTDSDGSFNWAHVRAGDYYLFATSEAPLEYANPAILRGYLLGALQIHIDAKGSRSERIHLATRFRR